MICKYRCGNIAYAVFWKNKIICLNLLGIYLTLLGVVTNMEQNQFVKGSLVTIIMKLLEDNGRMYGYEMTKAVRDITANRMHITEAALYPALHKMEADGMLTATTEMADGRMRKYYTLTKKGKKETVSKIQALKDALDSVQLILNTKTANG